MVDYVKILIGNGVFLLGYFMGLISQWILPPLTDFLDSTLGGIVWFGIVIVWILALIVIPIGVIVYGITSSEKEDNHVFGTTIGFLWAMFAVAILYFTWFWITPLANALNVPLLTGLFYAGLTVLWFMNIVGVPAYIIIQSRRG